LAVEVADLPEFVAKRVTELHQTAVRLPVGAEGAADGVLRCREVTPVGLVGPLAGRPVRVFRAVAEGAELGQEHVVGRRVFGVALEDGALEVLYGVRLAVQGALLLYLLRDRVALLGEAAVRGPVVQERAADRAPGLREVPAVIAARGHRGSLCGLARSRAGALS